jgi:hypothetical protein
MTIRNIAALVALLATQDLGAATFTVGPGGTHADVGSAWQALVAAGPGSHEVRIAEGDFPISAELTLTVPSGSSVAISGGWDGSFQNRSGDRTATRIAGSGTHRLLNLSVPGGQLTLENLSLAQGSADYGGLVLVDSSVTGRTSLQHLAFSGGTATTFSVGGCLHAEARESSAMVLTHAVLSHCQIIDSPQALNPAGSAIRIAATETASVQVRHVNAHDNNALLQETYALNGAAVTVTGDDASSTLIEDLTLRNNTVTWQGSPSRTAVAGLVVQPFLRWGPTGRITVRRVVASGNRCANCSTAYQVSVGTIDAQQLTVSELLATDGQLGVLVGVDPSRPMNHPIQLSNLTITGHSVGGLQASHGGSYVIPPPLTVRMSNSVMYANTLDLSIQEGVVIEQTANSVGIDPHFIDAAGGNFRLADTSPLIDAGSNAAPGLGPRDLDGLHRIEGNRVDIGAYEWRRGSPVFGAGFE